MLQSRKSVPFGIEARTKQVKSVLLSKVMVMERSSIHSLFRSEARKKGEKKPTEHDAEVLNLRAAFVRQTRNANRLGLWPCP